MEKKAGSNDLTKFPFLMMFFYKSGINYTIKMEKDR
jgi:hypothetical protein